MFYALNIFLFLLYLFSNTSQYLRHYLSVLLIIETENSIILLDCSCCEGLIEIFLLILIFFIILVGALRLIHITVGIAGFKDFKSTNNHVSRDSG